MVFVSFPNLISQMWATVVWDLFFPLLGPLQDTNRYWSVHPAQQNEGKQATVHVEKIVAILSFGHSLKTIHRYCILFLSMWNLSYNLTHAPAW